MDNILIPVTHAEEHLDRHAHIRRESAMLAGERVALLTRGIESGGTAAAADLVQVDADGPAKRATNWQPTAMNSAYEALPKNGPRSP
jgi:hypothetical protein